MSSKAARPRKSVSELNRKTTEYEFLGPPGALLVSVVCPLLVFTLIFLCNEDGCPPRDIARWKLQFPTSLAEFVDWQAIKWYFSFQTALALLWVILPGRWAPGQRLRDGTVLEYKCNGSSICRMCELMKVLCLSYVSRCIHGLPSGYTAFSL